MAFFLNNNTTNMFKAAKQLTNLSKDFTIAIKKMEHVKNLDEIIEVYEKSVAICSEIEQVSEQAMLSAGIAAAEDRIEEIITTTTKALTDLIEKAENKEETRQAVLACDETFAEEILDGVQQTLK